MYVWMDDTCILVYLYTCILVYLYTCIRVYYIKAHLISMVLFHAKPMQPPKEQRVDVAPLTQMCIGREKYGYWIGYAYTGD